MLSDAIVVNHLLVSVGNDLSSRLILLLVQLCGYASLLFNCEARFVFVVEDRLFGSIWNAGASIRWARFHCEFLDLDIVDLRVDLGLEAFEGRALLEIATVVLANEGAD